MIVRLNYLDGTSHYHNDWTCASQGDSLLLRRHGTNGWDFGEWRVFEWTGKREPNTNVPIYKQALT